MAAILITHLTRCSGGNHFSVDVTVDGGRPIVVPFTRVEIEEAVAATSLEAAVIRLVASDLKALWTVDPKPAFETERDVIVGKSGQADVVLKDDQKADAEPSVEALR